MFRNFIHFPQSGSNTPAERIKTVGDDFRTSVLLEKRDMQG